MTLSVSPALQAPGPSRNTKDRPPPGAVVEALRSIIVTLMHPDQPMGTVFAGLSADGFPTAHRRSDGSLVVAVATCADFLPVAGTLQRLRVGVLAVEFAHWSPSDSGP